jgi:hypothetical protein
VDVHFGSGNDTFVLNNAGASLHGFIDGGGGVNLFQDLAGALGMDLVMINF